MSEPGLSLQFFAATLRAAAGSQLARSHQGKTTTTVGPGPKPVPPGHSATWRETSP